MTTRYSTVAITLALALTTPTVAATVAPLAAVAVPPVAAPAIAAAVNSPTAPTTASPAVAPRLTLQADGAGDQDDMTFWLHPSELARSTVVSSDKVAGKLFVYDLDGRIVQTIAAQKPGNVDTRYGFRLGRESVDIIAFNERNTNKIRVYKVNRETRRLEAIDDGGIASGANYGFALYKNLAGGRFYAFVSPKAGGGIKQFELVNSGRGGVTAVGPLREIRLAGTVEGMVADDESGKLFLAEENGGIWAFDAEPNRPPRGTRIAAIGDHGLAGDVEGLALYYLPQGEGYLIASNQGTHSFKIFGRQAPHNYLGSFTVGGVMQTDGLEVINLPLNAQFSRGLFASHNGRTGPYPIQIAKWEDIAAVLGLRVDTRYWDPRQNTAIARAAVGKTELAGKAEADRKLDGTGKAAAASDPDQAPPAVTAALVPAGKVDDDEGRFRVEAACPAPGGITDARINDVPVGDGQTVKLELDDQTRVKWKNDDLKLKAPAFRLVVVCRDAAGNVETAAATPQFARHDS